MIRRFLMSAMVVALLATLTASSTCAQGFGSPVQASDGRDISVAVGPDVSSVPATSSFIGKERWELALNNVSGPSLTGAQISVSSAYDLTDSTLFRFFASLQIFGGTPGPPVEVPCSVTQHDAACPPSPSQALPTGTNLFVQANMPPPGPPPPGPPTPPWLAPGVPAPMTPGFDSAVSETAFAGGTASVHALVTLRDGGRYGSAVSNDSQIQVKIDGNPVPGSGTVTSSSGPVPLCGPPAPGVPPSTCFRVDYGLPMCNDSGLGGGSANFFLDVPQMDVTYDFGSAQTATATCPNPPVRAHVRVTVQQRLPCPGSPGCGANQASSITIPDADLQGSVTYRFDQPAELEGHIGTQWSVDYLPIFAPQRPAKIAFASNRDGNFEIYSMNADGSAQTRLTANPAFDATPSFSADGTKITFASSRTGNGDIYVMNADGSGQTRLTTSPAIDGFPAFSPDGTKIAFTSFRTGNGDIYVMNADGSGQTRLTTSAAVDAEPTWSSDGTKIAFTSGRTGNGDIYVMNADGSGQTRLTTSAAIDSSPDWSVDGTKVAFTSNRDGNFEIYSMNPDGTAQTRLTNNAAFDGDPAFLSTGKIAFASNRDGNFEIYSMNADGSGQTRLTVNPAVDISADAP
jgi:Tol biopolymer transport system component